MLEHNNRKKPNEDCFKRYRSLRGSNTVIHPERSLGRKYYREQLKKAIKLKGK
jgi:hypothetical protein